MTNITYTNSSGYKPLHLFCVLLRARGVRVISGINNARLFVNGIKASLSRSLSGLCKKRASRADLLLVEANKPIGFSNRPLQFVGLILSVCEHSAGGVMTDGVRLTSAEWCKHF